MTQRSCQAPAFKQGFLRAAAMTSHGITLASEATLL
jgi:hypothetical protein